MGSVRVPCFEDGLLFIGCETGDRSARGARPQQGVAAVSEIVRSVKLSPPA